MSPASLEWKMYSGVRLFLGVGTGVTNESTGLVASMVKLVMLREDSLLTESLTVRVQFE